MDRASKRDGDRQLVVVGWKGSAFTRCSSSCVRGTKKAIERFERKKFPWLVERGRASRTTKGQSATCAPAARCSSRHPLRTPFSPFTTGDQFRGNAPRKRNEDQGVTYADTLPVIRVYVIPVPFSLSLRVFEYFFNISQEVHACITKLFHFFLP